MAPVPLEAVLRSTRAGLSEGTIMAASVLMVVLRNLESGALSFNLYCQRVNGRSRGETLHELVIRVGRILCG